MFAHILVGKLHTRSYDKVDQDAQGNDLNVKGDVFKDEYHEVFDTKVKTNSAWAKLANTIKADGAVEERWIAYQYNGAILAELVDQLPNPNPSPAPTFLHVSLVIGQGELTVAEAQAVLGKL
jgi:hypothetical protein